MTIDICTVNYNTRDQLDRQIKTLISDCDLSTRTWKLHVADNDSADDSRAYLEKAWVPDNIAFNKNIGYAKACNQLAAMGTGEIIGLLNSDVWMSSSDILSIQQSFDDNPEMAIMGPKQRDEAGRITHAGITGTNTQPRHRGWHMADPHDIQFRDLAEMVTVSGSAYFIRREVWEALANDVEYNEVLSAMIENGMIPKDALDYPPGFLPTRHYYEETFTSYFARHRGFKVCYDGRISIGHSWHASHEVGSSADQLFHVSQKLFRFACDALGIDHD